MEDMTTSDATTPKLTIDLWMDIICPFCLVGDEQLEQALAAEGMTDQVEVRVHAFELEPSAPTVLSDNLDHLSQKYGMTRQEAAANDGRLRQTAHDLGLEYVSERPVANTMMVHRAVKVASRHGQGWALFRALQRGYFAGTLNPFEADTLVAEAERLGLDAQEVRDGLTDPETERAVRDDEQTAQQIGAGGVPFTVLDGRLGVSGAVGVDGFRDALQQAR